MDRLSVEVLNNIFVQLHLLNKIECMLVCRKWANVIRDTTLLHSIHIDDEYKLRRFFRMLQQDPSRGKQVKRLALDNCLENFDKTDLLELLPKLQFFELHRYVEYRYTHENYYIPDRYDLKRLDSLRCKIEYIRDDDCAEFTFLILTVGVCPRLTMLEVDLDYNYRSMDPLNCLLKNAPALKKLKLSNASITIADLEEMHANAPQLQLFAIEYSNLKHSTPPVTLEPAKLMTSLLLRFRSISFEAHIIWLQYIRQKYPNLQRFRFREHRIDALPEEMIRNTVVDNGLIPLLKSLGSQLKSLELCSVYLEPDLFKKIDKCDSKIEHFTTFCMRPRPVIQNIIQSSQCKFIQKLTLCYTPLFPIEIIKEMTCLKSLELYFYFILPNASKPTINLHRLFEFCPNTLETLRIDRAHLSCDATFNQSFPIKEFTFSGSILSKRVERFISFCLPDLRTLFLIDCVSSGSHLMLSNTNLAHLEIELEDPGYYPDLSVFTLDDNIQRFYPIEEKAIYFEMIQHAFDYIDSSQYKGQQRISPAELKQNGLITVECASLQKLVLNGRLAC